MESIKIKSIRKIENDSKLYDIETNRNHNFFANGILVHNSNFSLIFDSEGDVQYAKRTSVVEPTENFYNWQTAMQAPVMQQFRTTILSTLKYLHREKNVMCLQFVGELFGSGIQKRIWYGSDIQWRWFVLYRRLWNETPILVSVKETEGICGAIAEKFGFDPMSLFVPVLAKDVTLLSSYSWPLEVPSLLSPVDDTGKKYILREGIVIRPYEQDFFSPLGQPFILKRKNPHFADRSVPKEKKPLPELSAEANSILDFALSCINENRMSDLFSKYGPMNDAKDMGAYIGYYSLDVHNEIQRNCQAEFELLPKLEQKQIKKRIQKQIVQELRKVVGV